MGIFDRDEVLTMYSLRQAVEDGVLVEVFKDEWGVLSRGKPIAATVSVCEDMGTEGIAGIWNRFVFWRKYIIPQVPQNQPIFVTKMAYHTIWVIDEKVFFTIMYPEEY